MKPFHYLSLSLALSLVQAPAVFSEDLQIDEEQLLAQRASFTKKQELRAQVRRLNQKARWAKARAEVAEKEAMESAKELENHQSWSEQKNSIASSVEEEGLKDKERVVLRYEEQLMWAERALITAKAAEERGTRIAKEKAEATIRELQEAVALAENNLSELKAKAADQIDVVEEEVEDMTEKAAAVADQYLQDLEAMERKNTLVQEEALRLRTIADKTESEAKKAREELKSLLDSE